jgi:glutaminyl-tRNA synthetase
MLIILQAMDSDSTDDKVVLNRIVSLKEDAGK